MIKYWVSVSANPENDLVKTRVMFQTRVRGKDAKAERPKNAIKRVARRKLSRRRARKNKRKKAKRSRKRMNKKKGSKKWRSLKKTSP